VKLDELPESHTVKTLLDLMSRGNTHINTAAEVARAMQHDGLINEPLKAFTSCGASGACPQNTERDFHKWMRGAWGVELEPYYIKLNLEEPHLRLVEMSVFFLEEKDSKRGFSKLLLIPMVPPKAVRLIFLKYLWKLILQFSSHMKFFMLSVQVLEIRTVACFWEPLEMRLLMEEILHQLQCKEPCKQPDKFIGAGFLLSTLCSGNLKSLFWGVV